MGDPIRRIDGKERPKKELSLTQFGGLNVQSPRYAIADNEFSWIENAVSIGPGNISPLPNIGGAILNLVITTGDSIAFSYVADLVFPITPAATLPPVIPYLVAVSVTGRMYSVNLVSNAVTLLGTGFDPNSTSAATWNASQILITDSTKGFMAFNGLCLSQNGGLSSISVTNPGSGYSSAPSVSFSGGGGSGAAATAYINAAGNVTGILLTNAGSGYTSAPTVGFSGGGGSGVAATTYVLAGPIHATSVATYAGRAWVAFGRTVLYSDTNMFWSFAGGSSGSFNIYDQTLDKTITALYVANNYLYLFGDASIDVIGNVQITTGGTLSFTRTNINPSIGTNQPQSIFTMGRAVFFAGETGFYALDGTTAEKISSKIDPLYNNSSGTNYGITGCQVSINGTLYACFNIEITNGFAPGGSSTLVWRSLLYNEKKWYVSNSSSGAFNGSMNNITSAIINGVPSAYGFSNGYLYQLFSSPSFQVNSVIQTKLFNGGSSIINKQGLKVGILGNFFGYTGNTVTMTIDSENSSVNAMSTGILPSGYNFAFKGTSPVNGKYIGTTINVTCPSQSGTGIPASINEIVMEFEEGARW
jgi:hypothetical protein